MRMQHYMNIYRPGRLRSRHEHTQHERTRRTSGVAPSHAIASGESDDHAIISSQYMPWST